MAADGFRSYLQSYASYSHKKIFDVNKLDLVKVGKAYGFSVPPRVNLNIMGNASQNNKRRHRDSDDSEEEEEQSKKPRSDGGGRKDKRVEQLGKRKVEKEKYRKEKIGNGKNGGGTQWSR